MNSVSKRRVLRVMAKIGGSLALAAACGCVSVDGGAVELAWQVRTSDAKPSDCGRQNLDRVWLCLQACDDADGLCPGQTPVCPFASFPCESLRGSTSFDIAPGRKKLWITA